MTLFQEGRYQSGQLGQTVNLLANAFVELSESCSPHFKQKETVIL